MSPPFILVTSCVKKTSEWVENGYRESPEAIAISFMECIPKNIRKYLLIDADLEYINQIKKRSSI